MTWRKTVLYPLGALAFLMGLVAPAAHWFVNAHPSVFKALVTTLFWLQASVALFAFGKPGGRADLFMNWEADQIDGLWRVLKSLSIGILFAILFLPLQLFLMAKLAWVALVAQRRTREEDDEE